MVDAEGTAPERLTAGLWPSWTPDGTSLLHSGERGLYRLPADGGEPELLVPGDVVAGELSRDGDRLAYIVQAEGRISLVTSDPQGRNPRTLIERPAPEW